MKAQKSILILPLLKLSLTILTQFFIVPELFPYKYRNAIPLFQIVFFDSQIQR